MICDSIAPTFDKHIKTIEKSDRAEHITVAALRAIYAMHKSEELQQNPNQKLNDFIEAKIKKNKSASQLYDKIIESAKM